MAQRTQTGGRNVLLPVGTRKGAFILSSDSSRKEWSISGPHIPGSDIFHIAFDARGVYLGATSGQILYSCNEGDQWEILAEYLPLINSVEVATTV